VTRPLIAVPARFSATTSALRYAAEVNARALIEPVWRAGGEPAGIHPADPAETDVAERLARFDGVLLPGGGDLAPHRYGAADTHAAVYDVDDLQDAFDLEVARRALDLGIPLLAICRGLQTVNVALGGTLEQDMGAPGAQGWFTAVQWHPEDTADRDPAQQALFDALVGEARERR